MTVSLIPAVIDALRSIAFGSITTSYQQIGTAFGHTNRIVKIVNTTDADMLFSTDGVTDMDIVPAEGFVLYDITSDNLLMPINTPVFIKYTGSAPTMGTVYVTAIYAKGS